MRAVFMTNHRNLQKSKRIGVGADDFVTLTYEHYNDLLFLVGDDEPRPGISTIDLESQILLTSATSKHNKTLNKSDIDVDLNKAVQAAVKVLEEPDNDDVYIRGALY